MTKLCIIFSGVHGSGKTTIIDVLCEEMHNSGWGVVRGSSVSSDVNKEYSWPINKDASPGSQWGMIRAQSKRALSCLFLSEQATEENRVVVLDRCPMDVAPYTNAFLPEAKKNIDIRMNLQAEAIKDTKTVYKIYQDYSYRVIHYILSPLGSIVSNGVRMTDIAEQRLLHKYFLDMTDELRSCDDVLLHVMSNVSVGVRLKTIKGHITIRSKDWVV